MMKDLSDRRRPPARGLDRLTWAQVKKIDELADLMCRMSEIGSCEVELTLVIRNGHPRWIKHPLIIDKLEP